MRPSAGHAIPSSSSMGKPIRAPSGNQARSPAAIPIPTRLTPLPSAFMMAICGSRHTAW